MVLCCQIVHAFVVEPKEVSNSLTRFENQFVLSSDGQSIAHFDATSNANMFAVVSRSVSDLSQSRLIAEFEYPTNVNFRFNIVPKISFAADSAHLVIFIPNENSTQSEIVGDLYLSILSRQDNIAKLNNQAVSEYQLSEDGRWVAFVTADGVYRYDYQDRNLRQLLVGDYSINGFLIDSAEVRATSDADECFAVKLSDGSTREFHECRGKIISESELISYVEQTSVTSPLPLQALSRTTTTYKYFVKALYRADVGTNYFTRSDIDSVLYLPERSAPPMLSDNGRLTITFGNGEPISIGFFIPGQLKVLSTDLSFSRTIFDPYGSPRTNFGLDRYEFTPDNLTIVFTASGSFIGSRVRDELFSVPTSGSAAPKAINTALDTFGSVKAFKVSADSERVVYVANPNLEAYEELFSVPVGGGSSVNISGVLSNSASFQRIESFTISPDNQFVLVNIGQDTQGVTRGYVLKLPNIQNQGDLCIPIKVKNESKAVTVCL